MIDLLASATDTATLDTITTYLMAEDAISASESLPGQGGGIEAPSGFEGIGDTLISGAKWLGLLFAIIGGIAAAAAATISRQRGSSEEATSTFITIALAVTIIASIVSVVGWLIDASAEENPQNTGSPAAVVEQVDPAGSTTAHQITS